MVFVVPDEDRDLPGSVGDAVEYGLHMRVRPGVDHLVRTVVAVVAECRRYERERGEVVGTSCAARSACVARSSGLSGTVSAATSCAFTPTI